MRALVVEDCPSGRMLVTTLLAQQGFAVETAGCGRSAVARAREQDPDVIVLDVGLPDVDGFVACRDIRGFSDAYVVILTGHDSERDKVAGFAAGADDYVTKPFSVPEFLARVGALLRRPRRRPAEARRFGALTIAPAAREARLDGRPLVLTKIEFDLLDTLSAQPRVAFTRAQLLEQVWGARWFGEDHLVEAHVSNLRRKLGDVARAARYVVTVRGVGYRMGSGERP